MASRLHESPLAGLVTSENNVVQQSPGSLNEPRGSESTRTRRLQLRNAGFRGPSVRQVTPKSLPSASTSISTQQSQLSDAENVPPEASSPDRFARNSFSFSAQQQTTALQDIGNAADTVGTLRAKRTRPRVTSGKLFTPEGKHNAFGEVLDSPPSTSIQLTNAKLRTRVSKMSNRPRRSLSAESRRYIDHLEEELSAAQARLQAVNSPSVTREQSSNVRHMRAEAARLREEIEGWETQFDERLREEVDKCREVEQSLRIQLRALHEEFEVSKYRIQELEQQLYSTNEALEATESANVSMEKRIEFFSDLLATSPTKIDLHAQTPGRPRHSRPPSILPRFPTANSLARSPERQPTSPIQTRFSPGQPISPTNAAYSPDVTSSEEDVPPSEFSGFSSSIQQPNAKKPMRRMRRFGAGSIGPKPLILPSTAHCEQVPASAPPYESGEYDFDTVFRFSAERGMAEPSSPMLHRRRASTMASSSGSPVHLAGSPFPDFQAIEGLHDHDSGQDAASLRDSTSPYHATRFSSEYDALLDGALDDRTSGATSQGTPRNFSSLGSVAGAAIGRNLLDELEAAQSHSSGGRASHILESSEGAYTSSSPFVSNASDDQQGVDTTPERTDPTRFPSDSSTAVAAIPRGLSLPNLQHSASHKTLGVQSIRSISTLDSLREFFGDMVASPLSMAKHLVERAQARLQIPRPLINIQWWLVGVLLGPMAKRRLLAKAPCCDQGMKSEQHLLEDTPSRYEQGLEYGPLYQTPPPSSSPGVGILRNRSLMAGKGIKRASDTSKGQNKDCPHSQGRWKHSPMLWLKFSMTLAIAVGIAFKDGPSSLLKEALCNCKPVSSANWRQTKRDAIVSPNDE